MIYSKANWKIRMKSRRTEVLIGKQHDTMILENKIYRLSQYRKFFLQNSGENPEHPAPSVCTEVHCSHGAGERMDFVYTGRACRVPKVRVTGAFYAGSRTPWLVETALIQKIMATETPYEGILGLASAVRQAHLDEWYLVHA